MPALFENSKKKFPGTEEISQTTTGWNLNVDMDKERKRRNLSRLYGMNPVSSEIYEAIMRADNGKATDGDYRVLEQHIREKTAEIRDKKRELRLEGGGMNARPGRIAETTHLDLMSLIKDNAEDEDNNEH